MDWSKLVTALAGVLVALPGTLALVPDLHLSPAANAGLLILALVGGAVLKQQAPTGDLSAEEIKALQGEVARLKRVKPIRDLAAIAAAKERAGRG